MSNCFFTVDHPMRLLKDCGPAALSIELTNLTSEGGGSSSLLLAFIQMIDSMLASGRDFDLAHAYLALFLKVSQSEQCRIILNVHKFLTSAVFYCETLCQVSCLPLLLFFSSISARCHRTPSPWQRCSNSPPVSRQGGRSYRHRSTNRSACCLTLRVHCCDTLFVFY